MGVLTGDRPRGVVWETRVKEKVVSVLWLKRDIGRRCQEGRHDELARWKGES